MPRNGSGTYTLPAGNPVVTGTTISSTVQNNTMSDVATALTNSIAKDGQTTPTANLPMGGFKHTNTAAATATTDYARVDQCQNSEFQWLTSVSGTNTITAGASVTPSAYAAGQTFRFISAGANSTAVTINVSGLGAKSLKKRMPGGLVELAPNDLFNGIEYSITYDGTQFILNEQRPYSHGADIASASTINLDTATGDCVDITGTTSITAITLAEGEERTVRFTGILTLTNSASLSLLSSANITTTAGDYAVFRGYASGVVRMTDYTRADGTPLTSSSQQIQSIDYSLSGNALTLKLNPTTLQFRSTTLTSGAPVSVSNSSQITTTISSGSTGGSTNAAQSTIVLAAINNAGTMELAWCNMEGGLDLSEQGLISTTAEGGAGGADSASVWYSTTARTNVAYRVVGVFRSTQTTAGTWAQTPSLVQGIGGDSSISTALHAAGAAPVYACRAWVNFDGTGTVAIRASGNVSSITDNGVGDYGINFLTAFQDGNYAAEVNTMKNEAAGGNVNIGVAYPSTTYGNAFSSTFFRCRCQDYSGSANDPLTVSISIFR